MRVCALNLCLFCNRIAITINWVPSYALCDEASFQSIAYSCFSIASFLSYHFIRTKCIWEILVSQ